MELTGDIPHRREHPPAFTRGRIGGSTGDQADVGSILEITEAISREVVLERLQATLVRTAREHAGADRAVLLLPRQGELQAQAVATADGVTVGSVPLGTSADRGAVSRELTGHVARTRERVILRDLAAPHPFAGDAYFRETRARSALCLPLVNRATVIGVLYLENTLAPNAFTPPVTTGLSVLAAHAALALEGCHLRRVLEERESNIRQLVDTNIIGVLMLKFDGTIVEANDAFLELVGYTRDDLVAGLRAQDITPAEWQNTSDVARAAVFATGRSQVYEKEYLRKDGSRVPALVGAAVIEGESRQVVAFVLDLTQRKQADAWLMGERRILEMVAKGDSLSHILDGLCELVEAIAPGVRASVLLLDGNRLRHGSAPSLPRAYVAAIDGLAIGPCTGSCGTAAYRGEQVIVQDIATDPLWADYRDLALPHRLRACWSTPVLSSAGKVIATFAMYYREPRVPGARDLQVAEQITHVAGVAIERTLTERKLRRSEAYLAEAQRMSHTGSWAFSAVTNTYVYWSDEMFRIWGFDPRQPPPDRAALVQRIHPEQREASQVGFVEALHGEEAGREVAITLPDGTVKHVSTVAHPVKNARGEVVELVGTHVDVTELRRADAERERLRQLESDLARINRVSMMGELAAALAHEIKQPIAAAILNAHACVRWLRRDTPDLAEGCEAASHIVNDAGRAADIVDRIGSLYRREVPRREWVDINTIAREMVTLLQPQATRHSIAIRTTLADGLPTILADRVQIQQVLMNLMLNGIEAMKGAPGELVLAVQRAPEGQELLTSVRDAGIGLPPDHIDRVFDAFFTTKAHGTGMGLSITRTIVESHGGRVWASPNPDRGATFYFTLPVEGATPTHGATPAVRPPGAGVSQAPP